MDSSKTAEQMGLTVSGTESDLDISGRVRRRYCEFIFIDLAISGIVELRKVLALFSIENRNKEHQQLRWKLKNRGKYQ